MVGVRRTLTEEHHVRIHAFADAVGDQFPVSWLTAIAPDGSFSIGGLPAGMMLSLFVCRGATPSTHGFTPGVEWLGRERRRPIHRQPLRLREGANEVRVEIRDAERPLAARAIRTVTGRLVGEDGRGIPRAYLRAGPAKARSAADGRFAIEALQRTRYLNIVPERRWWLARRRVRIDREDLGTIRFSGGGRLEGVVRGAVDLGNGGLIHVTSKERDDHVVTRFVSGGGASSQFAVPALAPGAWSIVVQTGNGQIGCGEVWITRGRATTDVEIRVAPALMLEVSIRVGTAGPYDVIARDPKGMLVADVALEVGNRRWLPVPGGSVQIEVRDRQSRVAAVEERFIDPTTAAVVDFRLP